MFACAGAPDAVSGDCRATLAQLASVPTIKAQPANRRSLFMGLLLLEALGAMVLLIVIVWWTMFSGRSKGEIKGEVEGETRGKTDGKIDGETKPPPHS